MIAAATAALLAGPWYLRNALRTGNPLYPLVVCPLNGNGHGSHDDVVNPAVSYFLKSFNMPPLLTP